MHAKKDEEEDARVRAYCGVWNNYTEAERDSLLADPHWAYIVCGRERGASGTPHLQFYVKGNNAIRFSTLKKQYPKVHWEICRGKFHHNFDYCTKDGDWVERGTRPLDEREKGQKGGAKTAEKWSLAKAAALEGRLNDIPDELYVRYYNTFKNIAKDFAKPPEDLPTPDDLGGYGVWLYGSTGTGKSHQARARYPGAYLKISNNKWWDGYHGQEYVIMDDLDKKHDYMVYNLKIWADRYAFVAETKGSSMMVRPKVIVVTSNYHPRDIWESPGDLEPILRRFKIEHIVKPGEEDQREGTAVASLAPGFVPPRVPSPVLTTSQLDLFTSF